MHSFTIKTRNALYTSRYLFIKYHHLEQGGGDRSGKEHSHCGRLQGGCAAAPRQPRCGKVSRAQSWLAPPWSAGLMHALSPKRTSCCLSMLQKQPQHPRGVPHPLTGSSGVFRARSVAGFPPQLALVRKLSVFQTCSRGGRIAKRNVWPTLSSSEGWEAKHGSRDRVLQLHLCQGDSSPASALSPLQAELKLEAGTGLLGKEAKLGNVY